MTGAVQGDAAKAVAPSTHEAAPVAKPVAASGSSRGGIVGEARGVQLRMEGRGNANVEVLVVPR